MSLKPEETKKNNNNVKYRYLILIRTFYWNGETNNNNMIPNRKSVPNQV